MDKRNRKNTSIKLPKNLPVITDHIITIDSDTEATIERVKQPEKSCGKTLRKTRGKTAIRTKGTEEGYGSRGGTPGRNNGKKPVKPPINLPINPDGIMVVDGQPPNLVDEANNPKVGTAPPLAPHAVPVAPPVISITPAPTAEQEQVESLLYFEQLRAIVYRPNLTRKAANALVLELQRHINTPPIQRPPKEKHFLPGAAEHLCDELQMRLGRRGGFYGERDIWSDRIQRTTEAPALGKPEALKLWAALRMDADLPANQLKRNFPGLAPEAAQRLAGALQGRMAVGTLRMPPEEAYNWVNFMKPLPPIVGPSQDYTGAIYIEKPNKQARNTQQRFRVLQMPRNIASLRNSAPGNIAPPRNIAPPGNITPLLPYHPPNYSRQQPYSPQQQQYTPQLPSGSPQFLRPISQQSQPCPRPGYAGSAASTNSSTRTNTYPVIDVNLLTESQKSQYLGSRSHEMGLGKPPTEIGEGEGNESLDPKELTLGPKTVKSKSGT